MTLPDPADYGLTPEEAAPLIEQVLDERAQVVVDGAIRALTNHPLVTERVARVLVDRLKRWYGIE